MWYEVSELTPVITLLLHVHLDSYITTDRNMIMVPFSTLGKVIYTDIQQAALVNSDAGPLEHTYREQLVHVSVHLG